MHRAPIRIGIALLALAIVLPLALAQLDNDPLAPQPEPTKEEISVGMGQHVAQMLWGELKSGGRDIDYGLFAETLVKTMKQLDEKAEANKAEGEAFRAENAKKEGVQTTESGLQYTVIEPGEGESPKRTDRVTVHYEGRLIDGTVFDSSHRRGEPATFPLNQVIPGWTEAVQLMKPGAKYELVIPSDLAYGPAPRPGSPIGPNQTLLFTVELLNVEAGEPEPARFPMPR